MGTPDISTWTLACHSRSLLHFEQQLLPRSGMVVVVAVI